MKKKLLVIAAIIVVVATSLYFYVYRGHRDIASESADFTLTVSVLQKEFTANDSLAGKKYQDKTIQVTGKVTNVDQQNKAIVMDGKLFANLSTFPKDLKMGQPIKIKGRFLGYDDLVEEFKMDQAILTE